MFVKVKPYKVEMILLSFLFKLYLNVEGSDKTSITDVQSPLYKSFNSYERSLYYLNNYHDKMKFNEFKFTYLNKSNGDDVSDQLVGLTLLEILIKCDYITTKVRYDKLINKNISIVIITKSLRDILKLDNELFDDDGYYKGYVSAFLLGSIPMLVEPKKLIRKNDNYYFGFLYNAEEIFEDVRYTKPSMTGKTIISKNASLNYMSSEVFDFILKNNYIFNFYEESLDLTNIDENSKEFESLKSDMFLDNNILAIARLYKQVEKFYFPSRMDFRGRIYTYTS